MTRLETPAECRRLYKLDISFARLRTRAHELISRFIGGMQAEIAWPDEPVAPRPAWVDV